MEVYKYCNTKKESFENLKNKELWFSNPSKFKDKDDSNLKMTSEEYELFLQKSIKFIEKTPPETYIDSKPHLFEEKLNTRKNTSNLPETFNEFKEKYIGITCFSMGNEDEEKMWNEYGEKHEGFKLCFETNNDLDFFRDINPVNYFDKLPTFHLTSENLLEVYEEYYFSKEKKNYKFENETRVLKLQQGLINYNENCLTEIILGKHINKNNKRLILEIISKHYNNEILITSE